MRRLSVGVFCMALSTALSASACGNEVDGIKCRPYIKTLFNLPVAEKLAQFERYDLPTQYDAYICGVQVMHPPELELADALAKRGAVAATFLNEKLSRTSSELTTRDLLMVFLRMAKTKTYDVRADQDLLSQLRIKVGAMKGIWKATAQGMLAEIEKGD